MNEPRTTQCPECRGMGDCPTCDGTGKIEAARGPAAPSDNAGRSPIDVETWNAAIDAATVAIGNVEPVRKVGASWDIARSDALVALLGVRRPSEPTGSVRSGRSTEDEG